MADARVKAQLGRGERLRALLEQPQYVPLRLADEVALAIALRGRLLDDVPVADIATVRERLPGWLDARAASLVASIQSTGRLDQAQRERLLATLRELIAPLARPA